MKEFIKSKLREEQKSSEERHQEQVEEDKSQVGFLAGDRRLLITKPRHLRALIREHPIICTFLYFR